MQKVLRDVLAFVTIIPAGVLASIAKYPELKDPLKLQLEFYKAQFKPKTLQQVHKDFKEMKPDVRKMFDQVETLLRLCLISSASSCSAECSFSTLR